ncbi:glyoxalase/bleomycin resistance/extradiol dioxygenase family protein [Segetibacter sp. 3557_3]|uniref:VOC family protein n=1 Tax=Segetibacter sp. 3557_3 TaxID=2547429 RepID=UPI001058D660|nr:VOC family protein [Segetibacter sp. 3557_3]TDH21259.1 glyoxalase/bleomycin resistance/extradiol dioxygenase family protein [Segetibacter sp. 3557_3]
MATKMFLNLPVEDLNNSIEFFTKLGYTFNQQFTNENATCMIISEDIYVMLLVRPFFKSFITKEIADTKTSVEAITCLSADSKELVDQMISKAIDAGGTTYREPQDMGFMYSHAYQDLDGHLWEIVWMDPAAVNPA